MKYIGWFVSRITKKKKLVNAFAQNLYGGRVSAHQRPPLTFGADADKGTHPGFLF